MAFLASMLSKDASTELLCRCLGLALISPPSSTPVFAEPPGFSSFGSEAPSSSLDPSFSMSM
ncbi:Basic-leucine zipper transcription factor family protein [Prunus dulcis]|uniref:Basic-leucine zipper transcription factor family protein n=1 Tax=Prunus dulcis TaxID=3755 RepID=A0A5H2XSF5_PRUDU|nr:Basic-leucine zipper transcription factor family protein [Prunus dulcis]